MLLGVCFLILPFVTGWWATLSLVMGSFFLYGPHVFLVSALPARFIDEKLAAAATGFIDGMGYIGSVSVGLIIPFFVVSTTGGWSNVFLFWTVLSVIISILVGTIYSIYSKKIKTS